MKQNIHGRHLSIYWDLRSNGEDIVLIFIALFSFLGLVIDN